MIRISKETWSPLAKKVGSFIMKHGPQIAGYSGIGGFLIAIGLTYKNAADIHEAIEEKNYKKVAKKTAPIVIAATASGFAVHYCCRESEKRLAAALLASNILNAKNDDLRNAITETVGEKKADAIDDKIRKNKVDEALKNADYSAIENTGHGTQLCLELETGRLFYSDVAYIRSAINRLGAALNVDDRVTISDFHDQLNLKPYNWGRLVGWDRSYRYFRDLTNCIVLASVIGDNDEPIITIGYRDHALLSDYIGDGTYVQIG